jgi:hypothetical protein
MEMRATKLPVRVFWNYIFDCSVRTVRYQRSGSGSVPGVLFCRIRIGNFLVKMDPILTYFCEIFGGTPTSTGYAYIFEVVTYSQTPITYLVQLKQRDTPTRYSNTRNSYSHETELRLRGNSYTYDVQLHLRGTATPSVVHPDPDGSKIICKLGFGSVIHSGTDSESRTKLSSVSN